MTKLFPSGNTARDGALIAIVADAIRRGDVMSAPNIALLCIQQYGETFSPVSDDELTQCLEFMNAGGVVAEPVVVTDEPAPPAAPTMTRDEAMLAVASAANDLTAARRDLDSARAAQKAARATVASAVLAWQCNGRPPLTQDALKREVLLSNQREREQNATRRTAITTKQFVQKQMRTGNRRGSVDMVTLQHMRARVIREKAALAAASKGRR